MLASVTLPLIFSPLPVTSTGFCWIQIPTPEIFYPLFPGFIIPLEVSKIIGLQMHLMSPDWAGRILMKVYTDLEGP